LKFPQIGAVVVESDFSLSSNHQQFWERWRGFIEANPKGFGLYVWKPYLISHYLGTLDANTDLLYLDAGCVMHLSTSSIKRLDNLLRTLDDSSVISTELNRRHFGWDHDSFLEVNWTKSQLLSVLSLSKEACETPQRQAGVILIRRNNKSEQFLKDWLDLSTVDNGYFISEQDSEVNQDPRFIAHRHDQSTFSSLSKLHGFGSVPDQTWHAPAWHLRGRHEPIWTPRWGSGTQFSPFNPRLLARECSSILSETAFQIRTLTKAMRR
jgi:hypothetical protein